MVRMIAVWGSPGCGKGVISMALASQLATMSRNTVIINTNTSVPALPCYLPKEYLGADNSLGSMLFAPMQNMNALKGHIHIHPKSDRIGIMGIASGESPLTYNAFQQKQVLRLLELLDSSSFDYVVFDCEENPTRHPMTLLAIQTSEYVLRIITPDVKGIEFEKSHLAWMNGAGDIRENEHIRVINPVHNFSPLDEVLNVSGKADHVLPFSQQVYGKNVAGELIGGCNDRFGIQFDKQIHRLAERIVRDEPRTSRTDQDEG